MNAYKKIDVNLFKKFNSSIYRKLKTVQKTILLICLLCNFSLAGISQADTLGVPTKFFYANGVLSSEGPMINGLPDGFWKTYYEDCNLKTAGNRKNHLFE